MPPLLLFLAIFVGAPLAELYVLIEVGSEIGAIPTIALSVFTAVLGGLLVRWQGLSVLYRVREAAAREEMPAIELLEGAVLLATGVLLLLPGFITDGIGFALLITPVRRWLIINLLKRRGVLGPAGNVQHESHTSNSKGYIEGEYRRDD